MSEQPLNFLDALGQEYINTNIARYKQMGLVLPGIPYVKDWHDRWVNQDGSEIVRDVTRERTTIHHYLLSQLPQYQKDVERFAAYLPDMPPGCRVAIQIPAHNEELNIYRTLQAWASQCSLEEQPLHPSLYEITVLNNGPKGYKRDSTLAEVKRFKQAFPHVNIHVLDIEFPLETGNVGMARKLITDIILQRSINRPDQQGPLYIESGDADILEMDKQITAKRIQKFDSKPYLDALSGQHDFSPDLLVQNDYLLFILKSHYFATLLLRDYTLRPEVNKDFSFYNCPLTFGWSSAFTAEAYALVGGYLPVQLGEDFDIGRRISIMRGRTNDQGNFIPHTYTIERCHTRMIGSVRRPVHAIAQDKALYNGFEDIKNMNEVRAFSPDEMIARLPHKKLLQENIAVFERSLTQEWHFFVKNIKDPAIRMKVFHRLMLFLGFGRYKTITSSKGCNKILNSRTSNEDTTNWMLDYHIEHENGVKIDNIGNITYVLDRYKEKHERR